MYSPADLVEQFKEQNNVIPANYANFGHIPYGQSLIGSICYDNTNPQLCSKVTETHNEEGTNVDEPIVIVDTAAPKKSKIMLVDRGGCSFVTKVRNAERMGASLVVVIDNRLEDISDVIMGDDGTGTGIRVPSMLIGKEDGQRLKDFAMSSEGDAGTLSAEFTMPNIEDKVHVELWFSSNNVLALDFIKEFDKYMHELEGRVEFEPRYVTWECTFCADEYKADECFGNGTYCAPNHERSAYSNVRGSDIIREDLRQHCLHTNLKAQDKETLWWDYIKFVHQECFDFISGQCSKIGHK